MDQDTSGCMPDAAYARPASLVKTAFLLLKKATENRLKKQLFIGFTVGSKCDEHIFEES
jgi:hypothetical protein